MTYLFWAFALVWLGLFVYLYGLVRRSQALKRQVTDLLERSGAPGAPGPGRDGRGPAADAPAAPLSKTTGAGG